METGKSCADGLDSLNFKSGFKSAYTLSNDNIPPRVIYAHALATALQRVRHFFTAGIRQTRSSAKQPTPQSVSMCVQAGMSVCMFKLVFSISHAFAKI